MASAIMAIGGLAALLVSTYFDLGKLTIAFSMLVILAGIWENEKQQK